MTDNKNTYGLYSGIGVWLHLITVLGRVRLSKSEFLEQLAFIESKNQLSDCEQRVITQLKKELENKEPNELPSTQLLMKLSSFSARLKSFAPEHPSHYDEIDTLLGCLSTEVELYLIEMYGGEKIRELHFPSWIREQSNFQAAMRHLQQHSEEQDGVLEKVAGFWNELLDLWLDLAPDLFDQVEEFRKAVKYVKAGK
jgi:hypothetical protein